MMDVRSLARAVPGYQSYLQSLRTRLTVFLSRQGASERGYCTPAEDDELLAIWIEWWRVRCALLETVENVRASLDVRVVDQQRFVVGFASALVLVDAARWLYRSVHHDAVLRRRLNQPHPEHGIPARSMERIERGMTKARHVAGMMAARHWYDSRRVVIDVLASDADFAPILACIAEYLPALNVSRRRLVATHVRVKARRIGAAIGRRGIGDTIYRLQTWVGNIVSDVHTRPDHESQLPKAVLSGVRQHLQPGDVIVNRKEYHLTNHLLPGYWPHAALVLGPLPEAVVGDEPGVSWDARQWWVLEAQKDGVRVRPLEQALACDAVCVLRPRVAAQDLETALSRVLAHRNKPYDFSFDFSRSQCLVCSEVVYRAYHGLGEIEWPLIQRFGRPTLSPEDLVCLGLDGVGCDVQAAWSPLSGASELVTGSAAAELLRRTLGWPSK